MILSIMAQFTRYLIYPVFLIRAIIIDITPFFLEGCIRLITNGTLLFSSAIT